MKSSFILFPPLLLILIFWGEGGGAEASSSHHLVPISATIAAAQINITTAASSSELFVQWEHCHGGESGASGSSMRTRFACVRYASEEVVVEVLPEGEPMRGAKLVPVSRDNSLGALLVRWDFVTKTGPSSHYGAVVVDCQAVEEARMVQHSWLQRDRRVSADYVKSKHHFVSVEGISPGMVELELSQEQIKYVYYEKSPRPSEGQTLNLPTEYHLQHKIYNIHAANGGFHMLQVGIDPIEDGRINPIEGGRISVYSGHIHENNLPPLAANTSLFVEIFCPKSLSNNSFDFARFKIIPNEQGEAMAQEVNHSEPIHETDLILRIEHKASKPERRRRKLAATGQTPTQTINLDELPLTKMAFLTVFELPPKWRSRLRGAYNVFLITHSLAASGSAANFNPTVSVTAVRTVEEWNQETGWQLPYYYLHDAASKCEIRLFAFDKLNRGMEQEWRLLEFLHGVLRENAITAEARAMNRRKSSSAFFGQLIVAPKVWFDIEQGTDFILEWEYGHGFYQRVRISPSESPHVFADTELAPPLVVRKVPLEENINALQLLDGERVLQVLVRWRKIDPEYTPLPDEPPPYTPSEEFAYQDAPPSYTPGEGGGGGGGADKKTYSDEKGKSQQPLMMDDAGPSTANPTTTASSSRISNLMGGKLGTTMSDIRRKVSSGSEKGKNKVVNPPKPLVDCTFALILIKPEAKRDEKHLDRIVKLYFIHGDRLSNSSGVGGGSPRQHFAYRAPTNSSEMNEVVLLEGISTVVRKVESDYTTSIREFFYPQSKLYLTPPPEFTVDPTHFEKQYTGAEADLQLLTFNANERHIIHFPATTLPDGRVLSASSVVVSLLHSPDKSHRWPRPVVKPLPTAMREGESQSYRGAKSERNVVAGGMGLLIRWRIAPAAASESNRPSTIAKVLSRGSRDKGQGGRAEKSFLGSSIRDHKSSASFSFILTAVYRGQAYMLPTEVRHDRMFAVVNNKDEGGGDGGEHQRSYVVLTAEGFRITAAASPIDPRNQLEKNFLESALMGESLVDESEDLGAHTANGWQPYEQSEWAWYYD